ncbi:hypothetical protein BH10CHL1_BH10CHL1_27320 [soil metagenome]
MNAGDISLLNLPTLLIGVLLLTAAITYVLRRIEWLTMPLSALVSGGLGFWLWHLDLTVASSRFLFVGPLVAINAPLLRLGFTLQLQPSAVPILVTSLLLAAGAFLLAQVVSQGHSFAPLLFVLLAGYVVLALMTAGPLAPPLLGPLLLIAVSCMGVFILQAGRLTHPAGPLRTLIPPMLAFPLFVIAAWYIDQIPLNPQDMAAQQMAGRLLAVGLILLLAPVPLHTAQPATAQSAPPIAAGLVTLLYQLALLHLYFRVINLYPFVEQVTMLDQWLIWAGLATAVWGGLAAAGALHPGRLWGYSALHDWGLIILILATAGARNWPLVLFLFGLRTISMMTTAVGLSVLLDHAGGFSTEKWRGAGNRLPWNSAAFLLGGLGLVGFPLSAGFTGHWAAIQIIAETDWRQAALVLLSSGGAIFGYIRLARLLFGPLTNRYLLREQWMSAGFAIVVLLLSASLAVAPQLLNVPINRALAAFTG